MIFKLYNTEKNSTTFPFLINFNRKIMIHFYITQTNKSIGAKNHIFMSLCHNKTKIKENYNELLKIEKLPNLVSSLNMELKHVPLSES